MSNIPNGSPNPDQIHAAFSSVFKEITPTKAAKVSARERLEPYRADVVRLRKQGYSWKQIAVGMHDPRIGIKTASTTLKLLFGTRQEKEELRDHQEAFEQVRALGMRPAVVPEAAVPDATTPATATKPSLPLHPKPSLPGYSRPATATGLPPMPQR